MDETKITMFWEDKKWDRRKDGEARNMWLHIYPEKKMYEAYTSPYCDIRNRNIVEVVRKKDIESLLEYLGAQGYTAIED